MAVNAGLLWCDHGGNATVSVDAAGEEILATGFLLPTITVLIATPLVRRAVRTGVVERAPLEGVAGIASWTLPGRAVWFGVVGFVGVASVIYALSYVVTAREMSLGTFAAGKLAFVFTYAFGVTPVVARLAMAD